MRREKDVLGQIQREVAIRDEAAQVAREFGLVLRDQALEAGVRFEPFVDAEDENAFQYSSFSE